ncbi:sigma-54-dependent transcriptional regulator [Geomonas ferrireducens]|uniref:sigma-54-dependent transcriptional regulator n=1 Tax=Geomonas ferrireducens TaxID=2570227 RepID=UPI0010A93BF0|nr:sigma-54 dependent transcriptional regulator [Geomonas ferrireducens]
MSEALYPAFGVLLVDDEAPWLRSLRMTLEGPGAISNIMTLTDSREVMGVLDKGHIGLVLLDLTMPYLSGQELLARIAEEHPEVTVVILSGLNQIETAVSCMRLGAFDYLVKTDEEDRILDSVRRAIRMQELQLENKEMRRRFLNDRLECPEAFAPLVTNNKAMRSIFQYIEAVAKSTQPILITGESGVGKELIARAVHTLSRGDGPLVPVNVAGLEDNVFTDTLFGHKKGAFTGADESRSGMVEQAAEGTLFLDEIGDLSLACQVKLLRLLQEGEYYPLGSDQPKQLRARIVVATHHDLSRKKDAGSFRKDLYFRLRAHHVHIPPLRERKDDIPLLLDYFLKESAEVFGKKVPSYPKELLTLLANYGFPGNLRELRSMVFDAMSVHSSRMLSMNSFRQAMEVKGGEHGETAVPDGGVASGEQNVFASLCEIPTLSSAVEQLVIEAMRRADNNQSMASRMLGISQPALSKRLKLQRSCKDKDADD